MKDRGGSEVSISDVCDSKAREIYLIGAVDIEKAGAVISALRRLDRKKGAITLIISSTGGDEGAGWAIYDSLRICRNDTIAMCFGECQSIAALILQGCGLRLLSPNCRFMIHNGSITLDATVSQLRSISREIEHLTDRYYEVLAEGSGLTVAKVRQLCDDETFFSAQLALDMHFCDGIIVPKPCLKKKVK